MDLHICDACGYAMYLQGRPSFPGLWYFCTNCTPNRWQAYENTGCVSCGAQANGLFLQTKNLRGFSECAACQAQARGLSWMTEVMLDAQEYDSIRCSLRHVLGIEVAVFIYMLARFSCTGCASTREFTFKDLVSEVGAVELAINFMVTHASCVGTAVPRTKIERWRRAR